MCLANICRKYKIDILVCSESKLDSSIPDNLVSLPGYHEPIRSDRNRSGGGVIIYVSNHLPYKQNTNLQAEKFNHLWVDVFIKNKKYVINAMYRPPNETTADHDLFLNVAEDILTKTKNYAACTHIFLGDLNFGNIYCKEPILRPKPVSYTHLTLPTKA